MSSMSADAPARNTARQGGNVFTRKIGPMPMWAWLAIATVIILGWAYYKNRTGATSSTAPTNTANASQVPQFVNQTYVSATPPGAPTPPASTGKCPGDMYWDADADGGKGKCVPEPSGKKPTKTPVKRKHPTHHPKEPAGDS